MSEAHEIGRVSAVQSERLIIDLDPAVTGLVKAGVAGVVSVGSLNSYVTVPAGPYKCIAVVTGVSMRQESRRGDDPYAIEQSILRQMEAVLVGRIERGKYVSGVATYPSLFAPVSLATPSDTARIFVAGKGPSIRIGEAVVAPDQDVLLDANLLLGRHCAVVGSTGSGKSCTLTAILDGIFQLDVPFANIVIFDTNGEYAAAFASETPRGQVANACVIGPQPGAQSGLFIPHWFMDNEDHLSLFRASELAQAPLLQRSIIDARLGSGTDVGLLTRVRSVARSIDDFRQLVAAQSRKPQEVLARALDAFVAALGKFHDQATAAGEQAEATFWSECLSQASNWSAWGLDPDVWDQPLSPEQHTLLEELLQDLMERVRGQLDEMGLGSGTAAYDFDAPRYYSLPDLHDFFLPNRIRHESANDPRIMNYAAPLLMRLSRYLADSRYDFMTRVQSFPNSLARFLRFVLGHDPLAECPPDARPPWADAYESAGDRPSHHLVTILDLSLVASDVLENVTALLGRLILEFAQRVEPRAVFPILVVLEEAHRYIPADSGGSRSRSSIAFERIAKEGRKYGVSLLAASQRPSELSRTVLSQFGTLIAHRIVNPDDQDLIRHATPYASRDVLRQLPGLATQHAIVLGEAIPAPTYVRIARVDHVPRGEDPDFIGRWQEGLAPEQASLIDDVAAAWEAGLSPNEIGG